MTGERKPNAIFSLMFGACAGICGQTSSYPLGKKQGHVYIQQVFIISDIYLIFRYRKTSYANIGCRRKS